MLVLLSTGVAVWLLLNPASGSSRVAWSFQPAQGKSYQKLDLYPRHGGGVLVVDREGHCYALDAHGALLNRVDPGSGVPFWRADEDDASGLYIGNFVGSVYALDSSGKLRWICPIPDQSRPNTVLKARITAPRVGPDGLVYVAISSGEVAVLDPEGKIVRRFDAGGKLSTMSIPAVAADGSIYLVQTSRPPAGQNSPLQHLLAFTPEGTQRWSWTVPGHSVHSYDVAPDGTIYVVAHQDKFYALNPDGSVRWSWLNPDPVPANGFHFQDFTLGTAGEAYVSSGSRLAAFTTSGKELLNVKLGGGQAQLAPDGAVYFQSSQDTLRTRIQKDIFWLSFKWGRPITNQNLSLDYTAEMLRLDRGKCQRWQLPNSVLVAVGPGPEGEFYGTRLSPGATTGSSAKDIVRIDLVDK